MRDQNRDERLDREIRQQGDAQLREPGALRIDGCHGRGNRRAGRTARIRGHGQADLTPGFTRVGTRELVAPPASVRCAIAVGLPRLGHTNTPPVTGTFAPVINAASSLTRNATTRATSSGSPRRLSGVRRATISRAARPAAAAYSPTTIEGDTVLTVIFHGPSSTACARQSPSSACFAVT